MFLRTAIIFALIASVSAEFDCAGGDCANIDASSLLQTQGAKVSREEVNAKPEPFLGQYKLSAAFAEYVAMTLFVVIGCGSAMGAANEPGWVLQVALTFGLGITALAYAIGHYSGGQINCAVTLGLVITGQVSIVQGALNFVAQMFGSITGSLILTAMIPEEKDKTSGLGANGCSSSKFNAFVGEFMMTFLLMFVVLETAVNPQSKANREMAALAIGIAVFLAHSVLIPIDGCSINPTRSFGPALVRKMCYSEKNQGSFQDMWVFWAGPLLGATFAAFVSTSVLG